jgi:CheY-like chemotaxis protein
MPDRKTLLIVEDEEVLRRTLAIELEHRYGVFEATDGLEAVTFLSTHTVDLVLTDLHMPRMGGLRLTETIRQRWPDTKVLLCTRNQTRESWQQIEALEVDALIEKPFTLEEVIQVIEGLLEERTEEKRT